MKGRPLLKSNFYFSLSSFLHEKRLYIFGGGMRAEPKLMFSDKGNRSGNNHTIDITNAIDIISADIMKSSTWWFLWKVIQLENNTFLLS